MFIEIPFRRSDLLCERRDYLRVVLIFHESLSGPARKGKKERRRDDPSEGTVPVRARNRRGGTWAREG